MTIRVASGEVTFTDLIDGVIGSSWFKLEGQPTTAAPTDTLFNTSFGRYPTTGDILLVVATNGDSLHYRYTGSAWTEVTEFIDGSLVVSDSITTKEIKVDSLSSISANLGHVTAGTIEVDDINISGTLTADNLVNIPNVTAENMTQSMRNEIENIIVQKFGSDASTGDYKEASGTFQYNSDNTTICTVNNFEHADGVIDLSLVFSKSFLAPTSGIPSVNVIVDRKLSTGTTWTNVTNQVISGTETYDPESKEYFKRITCNITLSDTPNINLQYDYRFRVGTVSNTSPAIITAYLQANEEGQQIGTIDLANYAALAQDESITGNWTFSGTTSGINYNTLSNKPTIPDVSGKADISGDTFTGAVSITKAMPTQTAPTLLTLQSSYSDIDGDGDVNGNFIEFKATDANATFTPQVKIGMLVKDYSGDGGIISEGTGNFVVYTSQGTDASGNGTLTERFRVQEDGVIKAGTNTVWHSGNLTPFDGAYSSLSGAPTNVSSFTNDAGYITSIGYDNLSQITFGTSLATYLTDKSYAIQGVEYSNGRVKAVQTLVSTQSTNPLYSWTFRDLTDTNPATATIMTLKPTSSTTADLDVKGDGSFSGDLLVSGKAQSLESSSWVKSGSNIESIAYESDALTITNTAGSGYAVAVYGDEIYTKSRITVQFKTSNETHLGIFFHGQATPENNNYAVIVRDIDTIRVQKRDNSSQTYDLAEVATGINHDDGKWHTLEVTVIGTTVIAKVDGLEFQNGTITDTFTSGTIGLTTAEGGATTQFKDFKVERLDSDTYFDDATLKGNLTLNSAVPEILFNGTSDAGVDMAIKATPEGLDFYEPEQANKIHFQILDDDGVNAPYGYKVGGVRKDLNWDTGYTYSQVGHLPLSGGSLTGALDFNSVTGRAITITGDGGLDGADASIYLGNAPSSYGFDITYEGSGSGNSNAFVITSTNAGSPKELLRSNQDGIVDLPQLGAKVSGNVIYHAGNLTPSNYLLASHDMSLTLEGDATGTATFTNMGNAALTVAVANDSHTHDGRYYTETESDARFANISGDTFTGDLSIASGSLKIGTTTVIDSSRRLQNVGIDPYIGLTNNTFTSPSLNGQGLGENIHARASVLQDSYQGNVLAFKAPRLYGKSGSTWVDLGVNKKLTDGRMFHDWGRTVLSQAYSEFVIYFGNNLGYSFLNAVSIMHSTSGNSMRILLETIESGDATATNWTTRYDTVSNVGSWPGSTVMRSNINVGGGYDNLFRIRIIPTWTHASNGITLGQITATAGYGSALRLFEWDGDRKVTFYNEASVPGLNVDSTSGVPVSITTSTNAAQVSFESNDSTAPWYVGVSGDSTEDFNIYQAGAGAGRINLYTDGDKRLLVANNGDVQFFEDTGTAAKMVWDASAEELEIGSSTDKLELGQSFLRFRKDNENKIFVGNTAAALGSGTGLTNYLYDAEPFIWYQGAERMRIDSNGNVGIGTDAPATKLMLEHSNDGAVGGTIRIKDKDSQQAANQLTGAIEFESQDATTPTSGVSTAIKAYSASSSGGSYLTISTTDVGTSALDERMRLDSSGNLLVGKTALSGDTVGFQVEPAGAIAVTRSGSTTAYFNRKTSDGEIVAFRKDGSTVGSIGVRSTNNAYFEGTSGHGGFTFGDNSILPSQDGDYTDGVTSLGIGTYRFKDLYLSGKVTTGTIDVLGNTIRFANLNDSITFEDTNNVFSFNTDNATANAPIKAGDLTIGSVTATTNSNHKFYSITNNNGVTLEFSDIGGYSQKGFLKYYHSDSLSHGSGNTFTLTSSETSLSFAVDGKVISKDGFYVGFNSANEGTQVIDSSRNVKNVASVTSTGLVTGSQLSTEYWTSKILSGTQMGNSYNERVILLCPKVETNTSWRNIVDGKITMLKTGGNVCDTFDVFCHSVYNDTRATFTSRGQRSGHKLVTCTYGGIKWVAIKFQYTANPYNYALFQGQAKTNVTGHADNQLKIVSYYDTNGGGVLNSEVYNSIADYDGYGISQKTLANSHRFTDAIGTTDYLTVDSNGISLFGAQVANNSGDTLNNLIIGSGNTAFRFINNSGQRRIIPRALGDTAENGTIDLGDSGSQYKDIWLSSGVVVGGNRVIDSSRNLTINSATFSGTVVVGSDSIRKPIQVKSSTYAEVQFFTGGTEYQRIGSASGDYQGSSTGDFFVYDVQSGSMNFIAKRNGTISAKTGIQVNNTTVIDSSRNGFFGTSLSVGNATGSNQKIDLKYGASTSGYGAVRFYQGTANRNTIHSFSSTWQSGTLSGTSTDALNISGGQGVTFGAWNNVAAYITNSGTISAKEAYQVNGTTVIDSSRNLTDIGTASIYRTLKVRSDGDNGYIQSGLYLETLSDYRGTGVFMDNSAANEVWYAGTPYTDHNGYYMIGYAAGLGDDAQAQLGYYKLRVDSAGNVSAKNSLQIDGTTVIDSGRNASLNSFNANNVSSISGGHSTARFQVKYLHGGVQESANSGHLTLWASEPGITYDNCGIGGNVNVGGQYYGRQINSNAYGVYLRFDVNNGYSEFWSTTGNAGVTGGQGSKVWRVNASGDVVQKGNLLLDTGTNYQKTSFNHTSALGNGTLEIAPGTMPGSGTANHYTHFKNLGTIGSGGATRHNVRIDGNLQIGGSTVIDANRNITAVSAKLTGDLHVLKAEPRIILENTAETDAEIIFNDYQAGNYPAASSQAFKMRWSSDDNIFRMGHDTGYSHFTLDVSGNATFTGNVTAYSDARLKDNVETLDGSKVYQMRGVSFTKDGEAGSGVIAQELEQVAPELVMTNQDEMQTKSVAYGNVVGYLIEAIKELKLEIEELKNG